MHENTLLQNMEKETISIFRGLSLALNGFTGLSVP